MNERWTDFEKFVFKKLNSIESRLTRVEIRTAVIAASVSLATLYARQHGLF